MTKMNEKLDAEAIEVLKQVRTVQNKLADAGIEVEEKPEEAKVYETFMSINALPSKNKFYELKGQAPKVDDLLVLSNFDEDNAQEKFTEVFSRRIRGVSPKNILLGDEMFLGFWLREAAYPGLGFPNQRTHICTACKKENKPDAVRFSFSDISFDIENFDEISQKFIDNGGKISIELPISKKAFRIYISTRERIDVFKKIIQEQEDSTGSEVSKEFRQKLSLATSLNQGEGQSIYQIIKELENLPPKDFIDLVKAINKYSMVAIPTINMPCAFCEEGKTPVNGYTFLPSLYFPED